MQFYSAPQAYVWLYARFAGLFAVILSTFMFAGTCLAQSISDDIVVLANIPSGPHTIKMSRYILAKIYLKQITMWNDQEIQALNERIRLPRIPITVIHRSEPGQSTRAFTYALSNNNTDWATKVGTNSMVEFPCGMGAKGNDGIAAFLRETEGSIGYIDESYGVRSSFTKIIFRDDRGRYSGRLGAPHLTVAENPIAMGASSAAGYAPLRTQQPIQESLEAALQKAVLQDSQGWISNKYDHESLNNMKTISSDDGIVIIKGSYTYNNGESGWVAGHFKDGALQCLEYWDFTPHCNPVRPPVEHMEVQHGQQCHREYVNSCGGYWNCTPSPFDGWKTVCQSY
jgi:hypothetical protein